MRHMLKLDKISAESGLLERPLRQLQGFLEMQQLYNGAIREVTTKIEVLNEEFQVRHDRNPIHHIESRQKSPQSIVEKLVRKGHPISIEAIRQNLTDVAGVRVICYYVQDIYRIAELITAQADIAVIRQRDYIKNPKPNGYRSLHLVISIPVFLSTGAESMPVEIQIRTIAMDFWASLEHQLRYKNDDEVPDDLREELRDCAENSAKLDLQMQRLYERIMHHSP